MNIKTAALFLIKYGPKKALVRFFEKILYKLHGKNANMLKTSPKMESLTSDSEKYHRQYQKTLRRLNKKMKKNEKIRVVFLGYGSGGNCDVFSEIYLKFKTSSYFDPIIVVAPYYHDSKDNMAARMNEAGKYLTKLGLQFINGYNQTENTFLDVYNSLNPDIVFFDSNYDWNHPFFSIDSYPPDKVLSFYMPYAYFLADNMEHHFNQKMSNLVYMFFAPSPIEISLLNKYSLINGINICKIFLGYPKTAKLIHSNKSSITDIWKISDRNVKRIIWAPHHLWAGYSNFLEYKDYMLELIKIYEGKIQIAFKPHPALYDSLVEVAKWAKQDVEIYYSKWADAYPQAQLVTDNWIDLFLTSDAMILDSISFMAEYSLTGKPSCVITRLSNGQRVMKFNEAGEKLLQILYNASNISELTGFIDDIVLGKNDYKKIERDIFMKENYVGENIHDAAENIFNYIKTKIEN